MSVTRVLLAPDKFKGSATAAQVAAHLAGGIATTAPHASVEALPVADGGDGTVEAALAAGFSAVAVTAHGPTGEAVATAFALREGVAVVEMAAVSGLAQLPGGRFAPLTATSCGTGEVIAAALDAGATTVVLGVGGSASTDGGAGMLTALGARVLRADGEPVLPGGAGLADAVELDLTDLDLRLAGCEVVVACDVDNPLLGPDGAAAVYGPQKGADAGDVAVLDAALARWASLVGESLGATVSGTAAGDADPADPADPDAPGAGAAGGVGYAALAVLGAAMRPGIDLVLELVGFDAALARADVVVTGEGRLDAQTLSGKAPAGVAASARAAGVPVVAVCGRLDLDEATWRAAGFAAAHALGDVEPDLARCIADPGPPLRETGARIGRALSALTTATSTTRTGGPQ